MVTADCFTDLLVAASGLTVVVVAGCFDLGMKVRTGNSRVMAATVVEFS